MDFPTPNQSRDREDHTLFLTLKTMKVAKIDLLGEKPLQPPLFNWESTSELTAKT